MKMMNLICSIPENVGWALVGAVGMLCVVMAVKLGKILVEMWKEWHEDPDEFCDEVEY